MHAINRKSLVDNLVGAPSELIHSPCHPDQFALLHDVRSMIQSGQGEEDAREAAHPNGFEFDLHAYRERSHTEAVIGDLVRVGLKPVSSISNTARSCQAVHKGQVAVAPTWTGARAHSDISASTGHFFTGSPDDLSQGQERKSST